MNCPECNSAIIENEPFCTVCGIALAIVAPPVASEKTPDAVVAAESEEEEFDSTIMMSPEELAEHAALAGNRPNTDASRIPSIADSVSAPDPTHTNSAAPAPIPSDQDVDRVQMIDLSKIGSEVDERADADQLIPDLLDKVHIESENEKIVEPPLPSLFIEEAEAQTDAGQAAVNSASNTNVSGDVPPVGELPVTQQGSALEPSEDAGLEPVLPSDPIGQSSEQEIAKPSVDLPLQDFASSNPIFDSVRIIAPDVPPSEDFISTRIPVSSELKAKAEPIQQTVEPPADRRNPTTPNIGGGETGGPKTSKLKPLFEGSVLNNRYEIIRKIGGGGMGAVYLASDNNLGGVLRAVKEMVQAHIEEDQQEKSINDFKRESMILSSLDHPSIPTIFDYFYDDSEGRFYLVMKYISGGDLSARLRAAPEGKIDELTVTEWALQLIDVLNYLHNQPSTIVYRDLKPSNIMIDGNTGRVMLIDFGIARSISKKEEKGVTAVGTMGYAPPELFSGNVEPRSDIYSLGSTMFHLLTGADPQSNPLLIFDFQKNPRPRQINPRLSDQMEKILMRAVEYSADARFSSAAEMQKVLQQHLNNLKTGNVTYGVNEAPTAVSLEEQFVFCGFCGQRIVATDMFCAFCGAKQPIAQQGVQSGHYVKAAATAKLLVEGTTELPMPAFSLQKDENLVGRRDPMSNIFPEVDLSKFDPQTKISRRHARIWRSGDRFLLEDLGSSNGTMLATSGAELTRLPPHKPQILSSGDRIRVGDATLHFVLD